MNAEMAARRTAAAAVLADYDRDDNRTLTPPEWTSWAMRLGAELRSLLQQLDAEPERDPDMEEWLGRQVQRARSRPSDAADLAAICQLAALEDGTVGETVARWLRQAAQSRTGATATETFVRPDESASLSRQDRLTVLGSIATATEYLEYRAGLICADCEADAAEICDRHASDLDAAAEYRAVATRLGEDR